MFLYSEGQFCIGSYMIQHCHYNGGHHSNEIEFDRYTGVCHSVMQFKTYFLHVKFEDTIFKYIPVRFISVRYTRAQI